MKRVPEKCQSCRCRKCNSNCVFANRRLFLFKSLTNTGKKEETNFNYLNIFKHPIVAALVVALVAALVGALFGFFFSQLQMIINEEPDFSISLDRTPRQFHVAGNETIKVYIHNDRHFRFFPEFLAFHSYSHGISLKAQEKDKDVLPDGVDILFDPRDNWINGSKIVVPNMTITVKNASYKRSLRIEILAIGDDDKKRSTSFFLDIGRP